MNHESATFFLIFCRTLIATAFGTIALVKFAIYEGTDGKPDHNYFDFWHHGTG